MPDPETLIAARRARWSGWRQPTNAQDEIDRRRFEIDSDIYLAERAVRDAEQHLDDVQARLGTLIARREQYDALDAEIAAAREQRLHATYVAREPVVILSSGAGE